MTRFFLSLFLVFPFLLAQASAQVVTPSLDPAEPLILASASSWRFIKGENEQDDTRTATVALGTYTGSGSDVDEENKWEVSGSRGLLVAQAENVNMEASVTFNQKNKYTYQDSFGASISYETDHQANQYSFAYMGKKLSLGGSYRTAETTRTTFDTEKEIGLGLSATYQLGKVFFAALGLENVEQPESYRPANSWQVTTYGLAMMSGNPDDTLLRIEYANRRSNASAVSGTYWDNIHQEEVTTLLMAEVKLNDFLLSARNTSSQQLELSEYNRGGSEAQSTRVGIGYVPNNGMIFSAYLSDSTDTSGSTELTGQTLEFNLGYNF